MWSRCEGYNANLTQNPQRQSKRESAMTICHKSRNGIKTRRRDANEGAKAATSTRTRRLRCQPRCKAGASIKAGASAVFIVQKSRFCTSPWQQIPLETVYFSHPRTRLFQLVRGGAGAYPALAFFFRARACIVLTNCSSMPPLQRQRRNRRPDSYKSVTMPLSPSVMWRNPQRLQSLSHRIRALLHRFHVFTAVNARMRKNGSPACKRGALFCRCCMLSQASRCACTSM